MAVGITLETIAAPGATPISFNSASAKAFAANYFKLNEPNVSIQDTKGILILAMIYSLTAAGGANYKTNMKGLQQDAKVYTGAISNINIWSALAATSWSGAHAADGTLSADLPTLLKEVRSIVATPELSEDRVIAFLAAQLGI